MTHHRPDKDHYYLGIARAVAVRGTCRRRNYGAVIVANDQIVSTGYTGAPRNTPNCLDQSVPCPRMANGAQQGSSYDECRSVHAEMNAIIHGGRNLMVGATLYLAGVAGPEGDFKQDPEPCPLCRRAIINAGIATVTVERLNGEPASFEV
ncbi:MAG TPA: cytidine deaminase, partial [Armatimonadota bacterium]